MRLVIKLRFYGFTIEPRLERKSRSTIFRVQL